MNLYISGSNRKNNCFKILSDLVDEKDVLISLKDKTIKNCLGCTACAKKLDDYCALDDDMMGIYNNLARSDKVIIASPIYFNQITGLLKNFIDRLNPYNTHSELLKGKKVFLITIGSMSEENNKEIVDNINGYFNELAGIFEFDFKYLKNFTSKMEDKVELNYKNYNDVISELKSNIYSI